MKDPEPPAVSPAPPKAAAARRRRRRTARCPVCGAKLKARGQTFCRISGEMCCNPVCCRRAYERRITELRARSRRYATDPECIEAVLSLRHECRLQVAEYQKDERDLVDPLLMQWAGDLGRYIVAQDDPVTALARLLGEKRRPGKQPVNTERDRNIAAAVVAKMAGGMKRDKAVENVAEGYGLSEDWVKAIYLRGRGEAKAARHKL
jgi:hypothetical protein